MTQAELNPFAPGARAIHPRFLQVESREIEAFRKYLSQETSVKQRRIDGSSRNRKNSFNGRPIQAPCPRRGVGVGRFGLLGILSFLSESNLCIRLFTDLYAVFTSCALR